MRTLCSSDAIFWQPMPEITLAGIPLTFYRNLLDDTFTSEVAPLLRNHCCDSSAPCSVLKRAMQICIPYLSVCKQWKTFVSTILARPSYSILKSSRFVDPSHISASYSIAKTHSLSGRYRAYTTIESAFHKSVCNAYDYGGPDGCHGKVEVVLKISRALKQIENEKDVYEWLATVKTFPSYVPQLYFGGDYGPRSPYYGLVLGKLGPDLETLRQRCPHKRYSPRMTLAVAIQTIRIYAMFHSSGWLHCNAKPGNFAIGPDIPGQNSQIFMFDFEYSYRSGPYPDFKNTPCVAWNFRFQPINLKLGLTLSRRDDLEGLGYVFSYLERGGHPWQNVISDDDIWRQKARTPTNILFEAMDPAYGSYFDYVKALAWGEWPDYDRLIQQFTEAWKRMGYLDSPLEIDWWSEFKLRN